MRLNDNIDSSILTITPYGIAKELEQIYGASYTGSWYAETVLQDIAHSTLNNISGELGTYYALQYLNQKLEAVRKTISFWDAYQIYGTTQETNLSSQLVQLPANSSLVNKEKLPFLWKDQTGESHTVYTGDIFIKDYNGNVSLIAATNKGVYKPIGVNVVSGNTYQISYKYETEADEGDLAPISVPIPGSDDNSGYNVRNIIPARTASDVYGTANFSVLYTDETYTTSIFPIVKYFNSDNEQVFNAVTIEKQGTGSAAKWVLTNYCYESLTYEVR